MKGQWSEISDLEPYMMHEASQSFLMLSISSPQRQRCITYFDSIASVSSGTECQGRADISFL